MELMPVELRLCPHLIANSLCTFAASPQVHRSLTVQVTPASGIALVLKARSFFHFERPWSRAQIV